MSPPQAPPASSSPSPPAPPGRARYGWIVGIVGLVVLAYILLNTLRTEGPGSTGPMAGEPLPVFAAPLVDSTLEGDANVARRADQGDAGHVPACDVDDPRALNVCTLVRRGPLVLAFLTAKGGACADELDAMQEISGRFPDVSFAAIGIKGDREQFRVLAQKHGWSFPVAQDRDGAVANIYGVAVCPTVVLARRGGEVAETLVGSVSAPQLAQRVRGL